MPATTTTTTTIGVVVMLPEEEEGKEGAVSTTTTATTEGKKRKAEVLAEGSKSKFVFNKRGKLKDDEIKELWRVGMTLG